MAYVWHRDLAKILRDAGLIVIEHEGWKTRGRPTNLSFVPNGTLLHHDASAAGPSPTLARYIAVIGRPPGTPPPLAQLWVSKTGVWHVLAAGRANHAGAGNGWGNIKANTGNSATLGVEWDHTTGEAITKAEYESLVTGFAAIHKAKGWNVSKNLAGHKEYAAGRKIDPSGVDMAKFRRDVAARMKTVGRAPAPVVWEWNPDVKSDLATIQGQFQIVQGVRPGKIVRYHGTAAIQNALNVKHLGRHEQLPVNGLADAATVAAWRSFELKSGKGTGSAATPDPESLKALQIAYRFIGPEIGPVPPPATPKAPVMDPASYKYHVRNTAVLWLKGRLVAHGYGAALSTHNMYDTSTVNAVKAFQKAQGWTGSDADGYPGNETLKRLAADAPKPPAPKPEPKPPVVTKKYRSFPIATSNVGTKVTTDLFKKAVKGNQIVGWQEVDSVADWGKLIVATPAYRNVGVTEQNPQHNTPISVASNWSVVDSGFKKLYDGESGISHTRHATWAEIELKSDPSLHVIVVNVHWPSAAFGPSGNIREKGDRIGLRVDMWNDARAETLDLIQEVSDNGRLPVILTGDFNRQVKPAYSSEDFGRKTQAFDHGLDWIYLIDGDNEQFSGGAESLRAVGSDHKTFVKIVNITWA